VINAARNGLMPALGPLAAAQWSHAAIIDPSAVPAICQNQHGPVTKPVTQLVELLPRISHVCKILPTNDQQVHRGQT
jgi:hypothetical protein